MLGAADELAGISRDQAAAPRFATRHFVIPLPAQPALSDRPTAGALLETIHGARQRQRVELLTVLLHAGESEYVGFDARGGIIDELDQGVGGEMIQDAGTWQQSRYPLDVLVGAAIEHAAVILCRAGVVAGAQQVDIGTVDCAAVADEHVLD